jgi:hypothetical protein
MDLFGVIAFKREESGRQAGLPSLRPRWGLAWAGIFLLKVFLFCIHSYQLIKPMLLKFLQ